MSILSACNGDGTDDLTSASDRLWICVYRDVCVTNLTKMHGMIIDEDDIVIMFVGMSDVREKTVCVVSG